MTWREQGEEALGDLVEEIANDPTSVHGALEILVEHMGTAGAHHKQWVIDQVARALAGDRYEDLVKAFCLGEDGPDSYEWDEGTAP